MLIADRAALLLLDADGRRRAPARAVAAVLAGALLSELVLRRRLDLDPGTEALRVHPGPDPEPRLAAALAVVADAGGDVGRSLRALAARPLWDDAVAALTKTGALRTERRRRFLVLTSVRWFPREESVTPLRAQVRAAVRAAGSCGAGAVDPATVSLLVLLAGAGGLAPLLGGPGDPGDPGELDPDEAVEVLAAARTLPPEALEALEDVETAVSVRAHALAGGDSSSSDTGSGNWGDGHHGGSDGGSGGSDSGGGGGGGD